MRDEQKARVAAVRGPVGSAKSTAMAMYLLMKACEAPVQSDGVRRSKFVIVRNTLQQLRTTCLVTIQQLLRPITFYKVSTQTIQVRFGNVESDWLLLPLDSEDNIQRLLSLELTGAWISEFREIDPEIAQAVLSRCGRYPSRAVLKECDGDYWYGVVMETNSFSEDSPWYEILEEELPTNWAYYVQPGAFEEGAENRENLPPQYYEDLMESNTPEWTEQYIHNRITPSLSGQAVFRSVFTPEFHISEKELIPYPQTPLIIGLDTGRQPAAVVCQLDPRGRLSVLACCHASNMGMAKFLPERLVPLLQTTRLKGIPSYIVLDPVCIRKGEWGEENVLEGCRAEGFEAVPAQTNSLDPRLRAVDKFLTRQVDGGPALIFDREHCGDLILAMQSRYRYKLKKDKSLEDKPDKNHPWSDLADALQYACLGTDARLRGKVFRQKPVLSPEPVSAAGWT